MAHIFGFVLPILQLRVSFPLIARCCSLNRKIVRASPFHTHTDQLQALGLIGYAIFPLAQERGLLSGRTPEMVGFVS
jgi:hypothetical protein